MTRKPPEVNDRRRNEQQRDRCKSPCWPCLGRDSSNEREYQNNFSDALPLRGSFIEVTKENVSNRENCGGDCDSHPHGVAYFTCAPFSYRACRPGKRTIATPTLLPSPDTSANRTPQGPSRTNRNAMNTPAPRPRVPEENTSIGLITFRRRFRRASSRSASLPSLAVPRIRNRTIRS